jgi:hypothetical protein
VGDALKNRLFATEWVHAFEEDTAEGAVYRPRGRALPLSRRPRERLKLAPDGSATVYVQGPDDRYIEQPGTWREEKDGVVVRSKAGSELKIVEQSSDRLVVRSAPKE